MKKRIASMFFAVSAIILVSACSSGGDSTPAPSTLTGTAATGAPIDGTVFVKDAKGVEKSIATNVDGSFKLDVPGMTPPYLLKIMPSTGPELYSYASQNGQTVNLTPTTSTAMFLAYGKSDLNTLYVAWDGTGVTSAAVDDAEAVVRANLEAEMTAQGVDAASFNLFTSAFSANSTGFDAVMDDLVVTLDVGAGTVAFTDAAGAPMAFNEAIAPIAPPAIPTPPPAGAISVLTYSGASHVLNGVYQTACYQEGGSGSKKDTLTVTGTQWVNSTNVFTSTDCTGPSDESAMAADISILGTQQIVATTDWRDGMGLSTTVQGADGTTVLSASDTTVTTLNGVLTSVTGTAFGGAPVGFTITFFYMIDDTGSGLVLYRDAGGLYVSTADPFMQ